MAYSNETEFYQYTVLYTINIFEMLGTVRGGRPSSSVPMQS